MDTRAESPFTRKAKEVIRAVPRGRVVTYGQVAALAGRERAARGVAWVLHSSSDAAVLPWHRVINGRGGISLGRGRGFEEQKKRLAAEGVVVGLGGRVDSGRGPGLARGSTSAVHARGYRPRASGEPKARPLT